MSSAARTGAARIAAPAIRRATAADVPRLVPMLARAFRDDPVAIWACRSEGLRLRMLEGLYRERLRQLLLHGDVWVTPDCHSAALWMAPDHPGSTVAQQAALARCLLHPRLLVRVPLLAAGLAGVQRKRSHKPPHWYLSLLGTDPDARGRGLGSAVLRPVLEQCDGDGIGIYLESSKERNIDFYARHGFRVTAELELPRGPRMWPMWREPARRPALDMPPT
jgi:ribosomal protein S18 acetylase RimI-like enzyme